MKVTVVGTGMLREYFPARTTVVEAVEDTSVRALLHSLGQNWGDTFYQRIIQDDNLAPYVIALLNGLSISMKAGLDTELRDGDRLVFTIMVNGG